MSEDSLALSPCAPNPRRDGERCTECAQDEEELQAGFFVFFAVRCGRFLP